jgi:hypothetical protein
MSIMNIRVGSSCINVGQIGRLTVEIICAIIVIFPRQISYES